MFGITSTTVWSIEVFRPGGEVAVGRPLLGLACRPQSHGCVIFVLCLPCFVFGIGIVMVLVASCLYGVLLVECCFVV